nr:hypothetical protein [Escherichia coli]
MYSANLLRTALPSVSHNAVSPVHHIPAGLDKQSGERMSFGLFMNDSVMVFRFHRSYSVPSFSGHHPRRRLHRNILSRPVRVIAGDTLLA